MEDVSEWGGALFFGAGRLCSTWLLIFSMQVEAMVNASIIICAHNPRPHYLDRVLAGLRIRYSLTTNGNSCSSTMPLNRRWRHVGTSPGIQMPVISAKMNLGLRQHADVEWQRQ